jgi:GNAT superfamily N-acetyltransferase
MVWTVRAISVVAAADSRPWACDDRRMSEQHQQHESHQPHDHRETGSVRPATPADAAAIGQLQLAAWRADYADLLPADTLAATSADDLASSWREAITAPPSDRHRVLVAVAGVDGAATGGPVSGFAAYGPSDDPDLDAARTAEIYALTVAPEAVGHGHGSRLLAACADLLREAGFTLVECWVLLGDDRLRGFLQKTGWTPDGAYRDLDPGDGRPPARSVRLHAAL